MNGPFIEILGIAQDGGIPQPGCDCAHCTSAWEKPERVVCLGVVDPEANQSFLIEATPDFRSQYRSLTRHAPLAGIFLTHAHLGHYTGLAHIGKEAMNLDHLPVFASEAMHDFIQSNAPWKQLLTEGNMAPKLVRDEGDQDLTDAISVTSMNVPHRGEWSDTMSFIFCGANRSVLFVPDIDRWDSWDHDLRTVVEEVDVALIDGSFFSYGEVPGRDPDSMPHPTIDQTLEVLSGIKADVRFIHLNHTNPALHDSPERKQIEDVGYSVAVDGDRIEL